MESTSKPTRQKTCSLCGVSKGDFEFHRSAANKDGLHSYCKTCARAKARQNYRNNVERYSEINRRYRELYPERCKQSNQQKRRQWLMKRYKMTEQRYEELVALQGGLCALCGCPEVTVNPDGTPRALSVDHDHSCCPTEHTCGNCVRGLLCRSCNLGLGKLGDTLEALERAVAYMRKHSMK